jgi:hypothetical protein
MKTAFLTLLAVGSASAFAPSQSVQRNAVSLGATADLEGMVGVDVETGKKIVRITCIAIIAILPVSLDDNVLFFLLASESPPQIPTHYV